MALHIWDDAYSIGIAEIDQQHRQMFTIMESVHEAMRAGQSAARIEPALKELLQCCETHFQTEETLMSFHGFRDLVNHSAEHRLITGQLELFLKEHREGKPGLIVELLEYIEDWQGIHVLQHDMKYRDHLMREWGLGFKNGKLSQGGEQDIRNAEGRRFPRWACAVPVELRSTMGAPIVFAKCVNISQSGAFLRTWSPLQVNTTATAKFQMERGVAAVRVCVRRSEPCIGMGISFLETLPEGLQALIHQSQPPQDRGTDLTCERLLHDCIQNLVALEDVMSESMVTNDTAAGVRALLLRARRLERAAGLG